MSFPDGYVICFPRGDMFCPSFSAKSESGAWFNFMISNARDLSKVHIYDLKFDGSMEEFTASAKAKGFYCQAVILIADEGGDY